MVCAAAAAAARRLLAPPCCRPAHLPAAVRFPTLTTAASGHRRAATMSIEDAKKKAGFAAVDEFVKDNQVRAAALGPPYRSIAWLISALESALKSGW